jgi:hypothetical protein
MVQPTPYLHVPLNLSHAGRVARRILLLLEEPVPGEGPDAGEAHRIAGEIVTLLAPCMDSDDNPPGPAAAILRGRAAALGRKLVDHIERGGLGNDRLGQCVRNFFECLELGLEGAAISLRAGENPESFQRPV